MAWGLLSVHVIVLIPIVPSYHLRTSAIFALFHLMSICTETLAASKTGLPSRKMRMSPGKNRGPLRLFFHQKGTSSGCAPSGALSGTRPFGVRLRLRIDSAFTCCVLSGTAILFFAKQADQMEFVFVLDSSLRVRLIVGQEKEVNSLVKVRYADSTASSPYFQSCEYTTSVMPDSRASRRHERQGRRFT